MSVMYLQSLPSQPPDTPRDASREKADAAGERDLYAAWKTIFEQTRPTQFETARVPSDREPALQERIAPRTPSEGGGHDAAPDLLRFRESMLREPVSTPAADAELAPQPTRARATPTAEVEPTLMPRAGLVARTTPASIAAPESASDIALRVHLVRALSAPPDREPQPEVVSIALEGSEVSIVVRDPGLSESEALRAAFGTARQLTGRPESLQQLTLNGRVLYQHTSRVDAPAADVLFSC